MNNQQNQSKENLAYFQKYLTLLTLFLFAVSCLFAWNSYRALVGFIGNMFENTVQTLAMIFSYALPVICFIFFFFHSFIKPQRKISRIIYSSIILAVGVVNITLIALNFNAIYANTEAGNFSNFTTIGLTYPIDVLVVNSLIVLLQVFNLYIIFKPNSKAAFTKDAFCSYGFFKFKLVEKILITILAVTTMVLVGDFFNGFLAGGNAGYDGKYVFLMMLILIIPLMNFVYFLIKPAQRITSKKVGSILYGCLLGVNLIFAILLITFTFACPDFVAHVGKPLFPFTYTISVPIGLYIILVIIIVSVIFQTLNLIKILNKKEVE